jgi:hypothetical protein
MTNRVVALYQRQIEEVRQAVAEAEAGDFASDADVQRVFRELCSPDSPHGSQGGIAAHGRNRGRLCRTLEKTPW